MYLKRKEKEHSREFIHSCFYNCDWNLIGSWKEYRIEIPENFWKEVMTYCSHGKCSLGRLKRAWEAIAKLNPLVGQSNPIPSLKLTAFLCSWVSCQFMLFFFIFPYIVLYWTHFSFAWCILVSLYCITWVPLSLWMRNSYIAFKNCFLLSISIHLWVFFQSLDQTA